MSESYLDQFWSMTGEEREILYNLNPDDFHKLARGAVDDFINSAPDDKQNELRLLQYEVDNALRELEGTERFYVFMQIFGDGFKKFQAVMNGDYIAGEDSNVVVLDEDFTDD